MNCPNCGAEITKGNYCEFCGTPLTEEMRKERERLNKRGCPDCGSSRIVFKREKQGEVHTEHGTQHLYSTVGLCKDCGYTWETAEDKPEDFITTNTKSYTDTPTNKKKRRTWLWVLGWIFITPLPITILLQRKTNMNPVLKYVIIALIWLIYFRAAYSS